MVGIRPDVAFAMSTVNQFMAKVGPLHWMAVKHIMRYLKGTLVSNCSSEARILSLGDFVMWIGQEMPTTINPPQGYMFLVGVGVVSWKCKNQPTIALSTTKVEYIPTSHCTKEAIWFR